MSLFASHEESLNERADKTPLSALHPSKAERTNSVGVRQADCLLRTRQLISCPQYIRDICMIDV